MPIQEQNNVPGAETELMECILNYFINPHNSETHVEQSFEK